MFSLPAADKTQYFVRLGLNSTLQSVNGISSGLQNVLKNFNGASIVVFFRIPLAALAV